MDIKELEKQFGISDNEEKIDDENKNQELEDIINLLNSPEDEIININNNTDVFEGLSQEELDLLMKEDENISIDDIETDVINDISVYDNKNNVDDEEIIQRLNNIEEDEASIEEENIQESHIEQEMTEEEFKKLVKSSKKEKPSILIIGSIVVLISLILFTSIFFIIAIKRANNIIIQNEIEKDNLISKYTPSDKNTIYFDMAQSIDDEILILEKMKIGQLNTIFYFKNKINPINYRITLTDSDKNLYAMELNFNQDGYNEEYSILRFDPIDSDVENLILTFESISTNEKAEFNLDFNTKLENEKIKYINSKITNDFGDFTVNINYAAFSDTSTRVDYTIEPKGQVNYSIQQGALGEENYIKLKEGDIHIGPLGDKPISTSIENKVIGRMDFKNIQDFDNNVILEFDSIYKKYLVNKKISLDSINNGNISYNFDKYKVFLEGIHKFDNKYVLVLHSEDTTISTENRPDDYNRTEIKLDVELMATNSNGTEIIISPTEIRSAIYGTDIIFELDNHQMSILNMVSSNDIEINIKSALIKQKNVVLPINLNRTMEREIISHKIMEEQISNAFISRIQNINSKNIEGFSSEVLNDEKLINEYSLLSNDKKQSSISIISKNLDGEHLEAIVQEAIQIKDNDNIIVSYKTHKIKANNIENQWTIYYDEIIK